ncbi:MAG: diguanylate cyclase [Fidelibacterota bacterium]
MKFYRQILSLLLFFLVLILFSVQDPTAKLVIAGKGVALGWLIFILYEYSISPLVAKKEVLLQKPEESHSKRPTVSGEVQSYYEHLLNWVLESVHSIQENYSSAVYMFDPDSSYYIRQKSDNPIFQEKINTDNQILLSVLNNNQGVTLRRQKVASAWDQIFSNQTWRGSEVVLGVPIKFNGNNTGSLLVYTDHFSKINDRDLSILLKLSQFISLGMIELDKMEKLMVNNYFQSRVTNLFDRLEIKSDETELLDSIKSLCRAFFQYDKLTIAFAIPGNDRAVIKLVDGLHEDADVGMEFSLDNTLHGLPFRKHQILRTNSWFRDYPTLNRFKRGDRVEYNFMSILSVPIDSRETIHGTITLERLKSKLYSETDQQFLEVLAGTIGSIIAWQGEYQQMHMNAIHDGLTSLLNHKAFMDRFEEEVSRAERFDQPMTLVVLDLDKFKSVNDNYGHLYGDYVLKGVADIIAASVRGIDIVGRYGGEEFAVLLVNTDLNHSFTVSQRIVTGIGEKVFSKDGIQLHITISAGIAGFPTHASQVRDLIDKADSAMYQSKAKGGNLVMVHKDDSI